MLRVKIPWYCRSVFGLVDCNFEWGFLLVKETTYFSNIHEYIVRTGFPNLGVV